MNDKKEMSGEVVRYKKYKTKGTGEIFIPNSIARALKWSHDDEIKLTIEILHGEQGVFLTKMKKSEIKIELLVDVAKVILALAFLLSLFR